MGLIDKIKGIIFIDDQDGDEENVKKTEEKKKEVVTKSEPEVTYTEYKPPVVSREEKRSNAVDAKVSKIDEKEEEEKEEPKKETFPFPDFDEDEFSQVSAPTIPKKSTNVMDYERERLKRTPINDKPKKEYSRLEKVENTGEKKRFKNSPIISPVFGVLNEDYVVDDITNRGEEPASRKGDLDVQSVRDKAFGVLDEKKKDTEEVKKYESKEEKEEKIKTIDEMLEDTADLKVTIDVDEDDDKVDYRRNFDVEEDEENVEPTKEIKAVKDEFDGEKDVDNDLFDLMESMYDSGEDDE